MTMLSGIVFSTRAQATDPFGVAVNINNNGVTGAQPGVFSYTKGFSDVTQAFNYFKGSNLTALSPQYTNNSAVAGQVTYLGVPVLASFGANSNALSFSVPGLNLNKTFYGTSRDDAVNQLVDFLKGNNGSLINSFQQYLAAHSPVSPVAGNPSSLQSTMIGSTFSQTALSTQGNASKTTQHGSAVGVSAAGGQFSSQSYSGANYYFSIDYRYVFDNPGWQLLFSLPLGYQQIGSASTYSAQVSTGLQIPVMPGVDWYITPSLSAGATGSLNLGAAGVLTSLSVTSRYTYHAAPDLDITFGNMIGQVGSQAVKVGTLNIDPKISSTAIKTGVLVEYNTGETMLGMPLSVRGGAAETNLFGSRLYMNNYTEIFADVGLLDTGKLEFYQRMRPGFTLTFGSNYSAINFGLGYTF